MPYNLEVRFTGITLVFQEDAGKAISAFTPRAESAQRSETKRVLADPTGLTRTSTVIIPGHRAYLKAPAGCLERENGTVDLAFRSPTTGQQVVCIFLDAERLSLSAPPFVYDGGKPPLQGATWHEATETDLDQNALLDASVTSARLDLPQGGTLFSPRPLRCWCFLPTPSARSFPYAVDHPGYLAALVALPTLPLELPLSSIDGAEYAPPRSLRLRAPNQGDLWLEFGNASFEDVLELPRHLMTPEQPEDAGPLDATGAERASTRLEALRAWISATPQLSGGSPPDAAAVPFDGHFELYYRVAKARPSPLIVPYVLSKPADENAEPQRDNGSNCGAVRVAAAAPS